MQKRTLWKTGVVHGGARRSHRINTGRHLLQLCHALPSRSTGRQVADHQKRLLTGRLLRTLIQLRSQVCFFGLRWHRAALVAVHGAMAVWVADLQRSKLVFEQPLGSLEQLVLAFLGGRRVREGGHAAPRTTGGILQGRDRLAQQESRAQ